MSAPAGPSARPSVRCEVFPDPTTLAAHAARWLTERARAKAGTFSLCLSGGSTPKALYAELARSPLREAFPWDRTHLWWGDERFVPPGDALSNYRMVREALLDAAPIPPGHVHRMPTEDMAPGEAAEVYAGELQAAYGAAELDPARPLFDVTLLGLGPDGHTASLFPGGAALDERGRWVADVEGRDDAVRLTLTYPALEASGHAVFLVTGAEKAAMLERLRAGDQTIPAGRLRPTGELLVFCDAAAANG